MRNGRLIQPLRVAPDVLPFRLEEPTRSVGAGRGAASTLRLVGELGTEGQRLLALFPDNVPGEVDAQVVTVRRGPNAPPTPTAASC